MVRINLLPDLRQIKLRDLHRRRLTVTLGVTVCVVVVGVLVILSAVIAAENLQISSLGKQISTRQSKLQNMPNIIPALTAQQTLNTLPGLYSQRIYYIQLFTALSTLLPGSVTLSTVDDNGDGTITISGTGNSDTTIATFAKALATGTAASNQYGGGQDPFSSVTITSISPVVDGSASFSMTVTVNPEVLKHG